MGRGNFGFGIYGRLVAREHGPRIGESAHLLGGGNVAMKCGKPMAASRNGHRKESKRIADSCPVVVIAATNNRPQHS